MIGFLVDVKVTAKRLDNYVGIMNNCSVLTDELKLREEIPDAIEIFCFLTTTVLFA